MKIKLETKNKQDELLLKYLEENASESLANKINNGITVEKDGKSLISKKDLDGFMKYATDEAKKLAEKGATSAMVEDSVVFGWLMHYFEEDGIDLLGLFKQLEGLLLVLLKDVTEDDHAAGIVAL